MTLKRTIAALLVLLAGCGGSRSGDPPAGPRTVVLVTIEGLGRQALREAGGAAPILSELAARPENQGVFYTPIPLLLPATAALMTGVAPRSLGVLDGLRRHVPATLPTLAEEFRANGWSTAAVVAAPLVSQPSGLARGFDVFDTGAGYSIASFRYYPQARAVDEVVGNALRWLAAQPADRSGFLWIQLSDVARPYDPKRGPIGEQARSRLAAIDAGVGKLREALRAPGSGRSLLVVTSDRGQLLGVRSDLDGGFFLEPAALEVPLLVERIGFADAGSGATRPTSLTGLASHLCGIAGLKQRKITADAPAFPLALSAAPWVSCRWSPAIAALEGSSLWLFDGAWRRFEGAKEPVAVTAADVPASVAEPIGRLAAELATRPAQGPKMQAAEAAARKAELAPGAKRASVATPSVAERRSIVETLQAARSLEALGRPREALETYRPLVHLTPPLLAALHDMTFLQALSPVTAKDAWPTMHALLAGYGMDRMTLHGAAHAANMRGERDLAEAFLLAFLEEEGHDEPDALYDLACIASLRNDLPAAQGFLERAIDAGFVWWDWIEQDAEMRNLRASPGFATVMKNHGR